jgi:hypothetical protein
MTCFSAFSCSSRVECASATNWIAVCKPSVGFEGNLDSTNASLSFRLFTEVACSRPLTYPSRFTARSSKFPFSQKKVDHAASVDRCASASASLEPARSDFATHSMVWNSFDWDIWFH